MANKENESTIGNATKSEVDITALHNEIAKLKQEKAILEHRIERLTVDRDQYNKWWVEASTEKERLRTLVKDMVVYAKLV